jgi:hypothetical protein
MTSIEIFADVFILTGEGTDPTNLDFTFYTHEKATYNGAGVVMQREYYMTYDDVSGTFSDLAVMVTYVYTYNSDDILVKREENIDWYLTGGTIGISKQLIRVYETSK